MRKDEICWEYNCWGPLMCGQMRVPCPPEHLIWAFGAGCGSTSFCSEGSGGSGGCDDMPRTCPSAKDINPQPDCPSISE
jgi:hypothetical protein